MIKTFNFDINILTESDIDNYLSFQANILDIQSKFFNVIASNEATDYNKLLKKEKNISNIKLLMKID